MGRRLSKTVVMVGMMGAGKTAVGQAVARMLDVPFLDSDHAIEEAAAMRVQEIFVRDGEPFFRAKETQVISRLLEGTPCILSTGGGAWLSETNRALITAQGVSVWLSAELDLLWSRVKHKDTRPLLRTDNPRATLAEIHAARTPLYALADLRVEADAAYSIADMGGRVIKALETRVDIWTPCPEET